MSDADSNYPGVVSKEGPHAPLVSILIPAYNAERWIGAAIESALHQSWRPIEIIVVDDGSTDSTAKIASGYISRNVKVIQQPNAGAATARNTAFSASLGEYIQWLDADDLLDLNKVELQMHRALQITDKTVLFSSSYGKFYFSKRRARFTPSCLWEDLSQTEWLLRKLESGAHMQTATWLVSRELTKVAGPWDSRLLGDDDGEYFCRVLRAASSVVFVNAARVYYRQVGTNRLSVTGKSKLKQDALWMSIQEHVRHMLALAPDNRGRAACVTYLQKYMYDFCPERPDIVEQMRDLAKSCAGTLKAPLAPLKYRPVQLIFGWGVAKWVQRVLPQIRVAAARWVDHRRYRKELRLGRAEQDAVC